MRNVFLALVLANLVFAAWTLWYAAPPLASTPREQGLPIRLVGEVASGLEADAGADESVGIKGNAGGGEDVADTLASAAAESPSGLDADEADSPGPSVPEASVAAASLANASNVERCVSLGPFPTEERANAAAAALDAAGFAFSSRSAEGEIWIGFWVHIDAIPTREEANAMLAQLRENGVPDAYLIPGEEDGDIISLGVFNDMTRAGRLEAQVRRIGLVPVIVERSRPGIVHWLDVTVPAGRQLDPAALGIRMDRIELSRCPSDA